MSWEQILPIAGTVAGVVLLYVVGKTWALENGKKIGRKIGQWLPGDKVEQWLVEFLRGLQQGLQETYTEVTVQTYQGSQQEAAIHDAKSLYKIELKANPFAKP